MADLNIWIKCYHCDNLFEMDEEKFLEAMDIQCPSCGDYLSKEEGERSEDLIVEEMDIGW